MNRQNLRKGNLVKEYIIIKEKNTTLLLTKCFATAFLLRQYNNFKIT